MNKGLIRKIIILFLLMVVLRMFLIVVYDFMNVNSSHYLIEAGNEIILDEPKENHLYTIVNEVQTSTSNKSFYLKSTQKQEFDVLLDNLKFPHIIYINDKLASQNIYKNGLNYESDYAYKTLSIKESDYLDKAINIRISGYHGNRVNVFLAPPGIMKDSREFRTIINVVFFSCLFLSVMISLIMYFYNRKEYYFLILGFMGILSLIKAITLGELFAITEVLGVTVFQYDFIDKITTIINTVLPPFILCFIYDFKLKFKYVFMGLAAILILGIGILIEGYNTGLYNIMFLLIFITGTVISVIAFMKDKPYSTAMIISGTFYSSCVIYYILVLSGVYRTGNILFFVNPSYLGAVVYMNVFLLAVFLKYLRKVRELENKKKEYERVSLLRGISHDLKLPISIIKLNNQMIEKYDLTSQETKDYAKTSLEATSELEQMTDNINSYLGSKVNSKTDSISIKESFEKLKNYYSNYNQYGNHKFIVECDEKDWKIPINPLHFNRMLFNLVDNAFKYNKKSGYVKIDYKVDKNVIITVEDNGIGMDKEHIKMIFEPFYQVDSSRPQGGLGLGLSVVREIVNNLEGKIKIRSEKSVGTKITISLPKKVENLTI